MINQRDFTAAALLLAMQSLRLGWSATTTKAGLLESLHGLGLAD